MSKNNSNTDEILEAIKNMMSDNMSQNEQELPKDVIELTNPVEESVKNESDKLDILELSNPIGDDKNMEINDNQSTYEESKENMLNDAQIKRAVRNAIDSMPSSILDEIINEELTKIIQERLNSSKIIIRTENKKN
tara:strand:- start:192 stop:599 length:408 start_codon:yes stop_codon:yes gene_type:complete